MSDQPPLTRFDLRSRQGQSRNHWNRRLVWFLMTCTLLGGSVTLQAQAVVDDWAGNLLSEDPLAARQIVELEDLQLALQDDAQRSRVIERHFSRAQLTESQKQQFLAEAFSFPDPAVQQQAAIELRRRGELAEVVRQKLLEWIRNGEESSAELAMIGIQYLWLAAADIDPSLIESLMRGLASDSDAVSTAAARQLARSGAAAVPALLDAMQDPQQPGLKAAEVLSRIIGEVTLEVPDDTAFAYPMPPGVGAPGVGGPVMEEPPEVIVKASPRRDSLALLARNVDDKQAEIVRVYYGTNRALLSDPIDTKRAMLRWGSVVVITLLSSIWLLTRAKPTDMPWFRWGLHRLIFFSMVLGLMLYAVLEFNAALVAATSYRQGAEFGSRRSENNTIHYGYCDVSIPPTHSVGEVERPLIGPEDERQHVVLRQVSLLDQPEFHAAIRQALDRVGDSSRDCLLFIHGYNVGFDDAARRAAQIHYDLRFQGATMFFSWPSRASFHHYFSDRNEIRFSHLMIKQFLQGILENVDFDRFHVIAHSMGADALCQAILDLDPEGKVFDQIILAAPDIDADVFRAEILPALQRFRSRTTLYCSKRDLALQASKIFNDSLRAGDSSKGPLVAMGLDTIDASDMDTEMLGHSYYGNCLPLLDDLKLLIEQNRPPEQRNLEPYYEDAELPYWIFTQ